MRVPDVSWVLTISCVSRFTTLSPWVRAQKLAQDHPVKRWKSWNLKACSDFTNFLIVNIIPLPQNPVFLQPLSDPDSTPVCPPLCCTDSQRKKIQLYAVLKDLQSNSLSPYTHYLRGSWQRIQIIAWAEISMLISQSRSSWDSFNANGPSPFGLYNQMEDLQAGNCTM